MTFDIAWNGLEIKASFYVTTDRSRFFYINRFLDLAGSSDGKSSNQIMVLADNKLTLHDIHALRNGDKSTVISTGRFYIIFWRLAHIVHQWKYTKLTYFGNYSRPIGRQGIDQTYKRSMESSPELPAICHGQWAYGKGVGRSYYEAVLAYQWMFFYHCTCHRFQSK